MDRTKEAKIACIRTYRLQHKLEVPFGFSQWHFDRRQALLIEVITEGGACGWGECYGPAQVTQVAVHSFYAPLIIGENALRNEAIWNRCWQASLDFARKGVMMGAISGLDMALMDLKGKFAGLSAAELMGGRIHEEVPCYATGMYFRDLPESTLLNELVREAEGYSERGFGAMKIKVGKNLRFDKALVRELRRALPNTYLMCDSNHAYDLCESIELGRVLDENAFTWFEEPLSPESPGLFLKLHEKIDTPLAFGECEQTRWGFQNLVATGGVQILQPDLAYCGGPSEAVKIRAIASSHGINVIPHAWGTMLNLSAATHFLASTTVEPGRAEVNTPILEVDQTENPLRDEIFEVSLELNGARVSVPKGAGLGVLPNRNALASFCVQHTEAKGEVVDMAGAAALAGSIS